MEKRLDLDNRPGRFKCPHTGKTCRAVTRLAGGKQLHNFAALPRATAVLASPTIMVHLDGIANLQWADFVFRLEAGLGASPRRFRMDVMSTNSNKSTRARTEMPRTAAASLVSVASFLPPRSVSSDELEQQLGLPQGWMERRTGVRQRRWVDADKAVSDLAIPAGKAAIAQLPEQLRDHIGTLILATSTPDHLLPPTAPFVASQLGLGGIPAFDLAAACSGFLYGLDVARSMAVASSSVVLLIAANVLSKRICPGDPATTALFADAAGAVVVAPDELIGGKSDSSIGRMPAGRIVDVVASSDGAGWNQLWIPAGGSRQPVTPELLDADDHLMRIDDGKAVFRYAVEAMAELSERILLRNGWKIDEIDVWIPHQANIRIIRSLAERLNLPLENAVVTLPEIGNSSAATIPVALDRWIRHSNDNSSGCERQVPVGVSSAATDSAHPEVHVGTVGVPRRGESAFTMQGPRGKRVLLMAAGAGLTAGAALLEFEPYRQDVTESNASST